MHFLSAISRFSIIFFTIIKTFSYTMGLAKVGITHIGHSHSTLHALDFLRKAIYYIPLSRQSTLHRFFIFFTCPIPYSLNFIKIWSGNDRLMCIFMDNPVFRVCVMFRHISVFCSFSFSINSCTDICLIHKNCFYSVPCPTICIWYSHIKFMGCLICMRCHNIKHF